MTVEKKTNYGSISVSEEAVASLAGGVITECYGVVGMASKQLLRDGWAELLKSTLSTKVLWSERQIPDWKSIYILLSALVLRYPKL